MSDHKINSGAKSVQEINEAYSSEPWWYDLRGFLILTLAYRSTLPSQIRLFSKNMGKRHLEAAIGTGTLFGYIMKWRQFKKAPQVEIVGYDYAENMLAGARKRFKNEKQVSLVRADAGCLDFKNNSFDTINIANAIHCLPEIEKSLQEAYRVLIPGGTLAGNCLLYPRNNSILDKISTWINNWGMKKGILHRPYRAEEVKSLLEKAGFEIIYQKITGNCFDFIAKK